MIKNALTFVLNKIFSELLEISVKLEEFDHLVEVVEGNDGVFGVSGDVDDLVSIVFTLVSYGVLWLNCLSLPCKCRASLVAGDKPASDFSELVAKVNHPFFPKLAEHL